MFYILNWLVTKLSVDTVFFLSFRSRAQASWLFLLLLLGKMRSRIVGARVHGKCDLNGKEWKYILYSLSSVSRTQTEEQAGIQQAVSTNYGDDPIDAGAVFIFSFCFSHRSHVHSIRDVSRIEIYCIRCVYPVPIPVCCRFFGSKRAGQPSIIVSQYTNTLCSTKYGCHGNTNGH